MKDEDFVERVVRLQPVFELWAEAANAGYLRVNGGAEFEAGEGFVCAEDGDGAACAVGGFDHGAQSDDGQFAALGGGES